MRSLIVGDGYSARSFHLPALEQIAREKAGGREDLPLTGVVEHRLDPRRAAAGPKWLEFFGSLRETEAYVAADPVVHVCTPPDAHLPVLAEAVELGYRRFIIEKPLASNLADAAEIMRLERQHDLQIVVVANWLSSTLTRAIKEEIEAGRRGNVRSLHIFGCKPRIARSLFSDSHRSAFDVEVPHFLALALHLCGPGSTLQRATCDDLIVDERRIEAMGSATMLLQAEAGYEALIETHLASPVRERRIAVEFEDASKLVGHYPCGSPEIFSQVVRVGADGVPQPPVLLEDNTVYRMISDAYAYLYGEGPRPISDTRFHYAVCARLSDAKASCGMYDRPLLELSGEAA